MHFIERKSPLEKLPTGCVRGQLPYKRGRNTQPKPNLQESDEERVEAGQFEGSQSVSGHCEQSALKQSGIEFAGFAAFAIVVKRCGYAIGKAGRAVLAGLLFSRLVSWRFSQAQPAPLPFSSMNSTPAASRALRTASSLAAVSEVWSSAASARRTVFAPNAAASASSAALHLSSARAALIWAGGLERTRTCGKMQMH
jgi:hypothetical protein